MDREGAGGAVLSLRAAFERPLLTVAWFDFVLLEVFHFQTEFSPGNTGDTPELDGSAQQPLPCTTRLCSVTILGIHLAATFPVLWDRVLFQPCPPSGTGSVFCMCGTSPHPMERVRPSPTSQGG